MKNHFQVLDPTKVRERRIQVGLNTAALAKHLATSPNVIARLENGGDQSRYEIVFCGLLAEALGCELTDLLLQPEPTTDVVAQPVDPDEIEDSDVARIGQVLFATGGSAVMEHLAEALGWTLARTQVAIIELDERVRSCGQRVVVHAGTRVVLVPAAGDSVPVRHARRRDVEMSGLLFDEAALLVAVMEDDMKRVALPELGPALLARLVNAGLIESDATGTDAPERVTGFRLSDAARFNLNLDDRASARSSALA